MVVTRTEQDYYQQLLSYSTVTSFQDRMIGRVGNFVAFSARTRQAIPDGWIPHNCDVVLHVTTC